MCTYSVLLKHVYFSNCMIGISGGGVQLQCSKYVVLYRNIEQKLLNSVNLLHRLLNCEIGGLNCGLITESIEHVSNVYTSITYFAMPQSMLFIL